MRPAIAVTMGEPSGVGGEIAVKAWLRRHDRVPRFFLLDDPDRIRHLGRLAGEEVPVRAIAQPEEAVEAFPEALPVLPQALAKAAVPGRPDPANAAAVRAAIERAVVLTRQGRASAVVTNPIHKQTMYQGGFAFPGHTELLAQLAGPDVRPVMMLACPGLRVVPVTIHVALRRAVDMIRREDIVACGRIVAEALKTDFGIGRPRLAVAALNPHAGEEGTMGREEIEVIAPAVADLRAAGIETSGPRPADTLFHDAARSTYDAVLCMYHDQALIPLKTIDFFNGVNITLGLPFVRTSPDHGTALELAGTGRADEASLVAALRMADDMARRRSALSRVNA